jgi:hypothetical protein
MPSVAFALALAGALGLAGAACAESAHIQELDRASAFEDVSASRGVVVVDLFAVW